MQLSDFFTPLGIINSLYTISILVILDFIGFTTARLLNIPNTFRLINWVIGLGLLVFLWFILHFFLPFKQEYILITLLFLGIPALPYYLKNQGLKTSWQTLYQFPFPLLFLVFVCLPLFIYISLPPYVWDELAYHFYSPYQVVHELKWNFYNNDLYYMVPKFLETTFVLMFSLTKTYATARLIHFLIFFSGIYVIAIFVKNNLGYLAAVIYSFIALFLFKILLIESTYGYVDVAGAVLINLFFISSVGFILKKELGYFYAMAIFLAISIGIKYTVLAFAGSVLLISSLFFIILHWQQINKICYSLRQSVFLIKSPLKYLLISLILGITFGGYWYIKNYLALGNPIYPFLFACKSGIVCNTQKEFFSGWTLEFTLNNFEAIKLTLFQNHNSLFLATLLALILGFIFSFYTKNNYLKVIALMIPLVVLTEIMISKNTVSFLLRYYYHWLFLISLALCLPFSFSKKFKNPYFNHFAVLLIIFILLFTYSAFWLSFTNIIKLNTDPVISNDSVFKKYAFHQINLKEWLTIQFPKLNGVLNLCSGENPETTIFFADPKIVWYDPEGLIRAFIINCNFRNLAPSFQTTPEEAIALMEKNSPSYYISIERCEPSSENPYKEKYSQWLYDFNQKLVCQGKEVSPNTYILSD